VGAFIGGLIIFKLGIHFSLYIFGVLQALSTAGFALLNEIGNQTWMLAVTVAFEDLSAGMGTAAFMALMASLSDKRFTATQYALLTSLMGVPRVFVAAPTGYMAEKMGWTPFFLFCALIAIPGLLILHKVIQLTKTEVKIGGEPAPAPTKT
jgi:PAT family beta-lactamase induction signal transducer AmpG